MSPNKIYRGFGLRGWLGSLPKRILHSKRSVSHDAALKARHDELDSKRYVGGVERSSSDLANKLTDAIVEPFLDSATQRNLPFVLAVRSVVQDIIEIEDWFDAPDARALQRATTEAERWAIEDQMKLVEDRLNAGRELFEPFIDMMQRIVRALLHENPMLLDPSVGQVSELSFQTPMSLLTNDIAGILDIMVGLPFAPELAESGLLERLCSRIKYNVVLASGGDPSYPDQFNRTLRPPSTQAQSDPDLLIDTYLRGTPFTKLFELTVPISIPEATRFEHQHIVAGTGHGKTQTLQSFILHDLQKVAQGGASIVVLDSQGDLIDNIKSLAIFGQGGPLHDRLIVIDPTDLEYPVALNLFDVGMERIQNYSQLERERIINGTLELYDFVLGSLLEAGMTQKQSVIFRYITRLLIHIPNATIHTLRELLEENGAAKYEAEIKSLGKTAQAFFRTEFDSREFAQTKKQVLRRLWGILENQTFERMFSHPKSKLDMFTEMNQGKVILINTAKDLLKENGTEIFGRFFIALIAQAAQERATIPKNERMSTFVYIDEAQDYYDQNIAVILSQARKYKVGISTAHQYLGQLDSKLQEAVFSNTSIKFAGGVSAKDARTLAAELKCDPSHIEEQDKLSFAAFIRGVTKKAISISIPYGSMESQQHLSEHELALQQERMRTHYAVHFSELEEIEEEGEHDAPPDTDDFDPDAPMPWNRKQSPDKNEE